MQHVTPGSDAEAMEATHVAAASLSGIGGYFALGLVIRAARWVASKTRTTKDDRAIAKAEELLRENPELVQLIEMLVRKARD